MTASERSPGVECNPSSRRVASQSLDDRSLAEAATVLADRDPVLACLVDRNGVPPLWPREPGFATTVLFILEQQVSLASARAAFDRLEGAVGDIRPDLLLELSDRELKSIGFSRQKMGYARGLAAGLLDGSIRLDDLHEWSDEVATRRLTSIRGIGPWTASCYLLFCLRRPDVWPPGDRALQVSMGRVYGLPDAPGVEASNERARAWRPFRSTAARLLWHEYLGGGT